MIIHSIELWQAQYGALLFYIEWTFTLLLTLEFITRIYCSPNPKAYDTSFYGIVDLLVILPTYISLLLPSASLLLVIHLFRVLRIFRVLKLLQYSGEANVLLRSMLIARRRIFVFFLRDDTGDYFWLLNVYHRRAYFWFYQYSSQYLLGHRYLKLSATDKISDN